MIIPVFVVAVVTGGTSSFTLTENTPWFSVSS